MAFVTPWTYSQPEFYHFNSDSILLAKYAASEINLLKPSRIHLLDACSGSGVVGLEFLANLTHCPPEEVKLTAIDILPKFRDHFWENVIQTIKASSALSSLSI